MFNFKLFSSVISIGTILFYQLASCSALSYERDIHFVFYNNESQPIFKSNSLVDGLVVQSGCAPTDKLSIIVHGWREGCFTSWVPEMVKNLNQFRGGCIVCMDYFEFSKSHYFGLVSNFDGIAEALTNKLRQFQFEKFETSRMFMFGFSFGAQLVLEAGRRVGQKLIHQIDVCEPAGPGFDSNTTFQKINVPTRSAENVQCIHTSSDKGTAKRLCHQNWMLGRCGWSQIAAGPPPLGSHGLCPYMYNSAFHHRFPAIARPESCPQSERDVKHALLETGYYMGYDEHRNSSVTGDLYANTFKNQPYNKETTAENAIVRKVITFRSTFYIL